MNVNRTDTLYQKINYIREEIALEIAKKGLQDHINGNQIHFFNEGNYQENLKNYKNEESFYEKKEENEKIVDEEELLKSKFVYNKTFVNDK